MKSRRFFVTAAGGTLGSIALVREAPKAADFEFKLGHDETASHPLGVAATEFAAAVRRESGGRLNIKVFPDNQLGSDPSMLLQVQTGALELNLCGLGALGAQVPVAQIAFLGFVFPKFRNATDAMDGAIGALLRKALEPKGIIAFERTWASGFQQLATWNRAIHNGDDISGMKLRVSAGPISTDMFKALGASPVVVNLNEVYTSMQTHLVDGTVGVFNDILAKREYEVAKYLSVTNHQFSTYSLIVNAQKFQGLPSDIQSVLRRNANVYGPRESRSAEIQAASAEDLLGRYGMQISQTDTASFRAKLSAYYAHWKGEFGPTAWAALEQYSGKLV